jgi:aspartate/methionine/tyrosine aminotransferase
MSFPISHRIARVQSPVIPIVGQWVAEHPGTISMGQGVVYYPPPPTIVEGLQKFHSDPLNHQYKQVQGIPELLNALKFKLSNENGIQVQAKDQLMVTAGSNMAFMNAIMAITEFGDEVILPKPYYFNHEMAINMLGAVARCVEPGSDMLPSLTSIESAITSRTRAIVTISPNNPSGVVFPKSLLTSINQLCRERGIYHISDEAYEYFLYDGATHFSPGSLDGSETHTFSLFSMSKAYGFASWRIGYMVMPQGLMASIKKIQDTNLICAPVISQLAGVKALESGKPYCTQHLPAMVKVREHLLEGLRKLQPFVRIIPSTGAFYILIQLDTQIQPLGVVKKLIQKHQVAVIPGSAFGLEQGCYLRIAFGALKEETANKGVERLLGGLKAVRDLGRKR